MITKSNKQLFLFIKSIYLCSAQSLIPTTFPQCNGSAFLAIIRVVPFPFSVWHWIIICMCCVCPLGINWRNTSFFRIFRLLLNLRFNIQANSSFQLLFIKLCSNFLKMHAPIKYICNKSHKQFYHHSLEADW